MKPKLKPLSQQVIVITGASSGIGLATARKAAKAGAKVLLVARNQEALKAACQEIAADGGVADFIVADVGEEAQVKAVVDKAGVRFGGFDTWVNDAGVGILALLADTPTDEHERLFKTNYWGTVFGSLAAVSYLRTRGGALINVGSVASDMPSPMFGAYVASKHAVKGFTDSLRIEMIAAKAPVSVTLIKPAGIGTPFGEHSANHTNGEARIPPPVYAPEIVADAILHCAQTVRRDMTVGGAGRQQVMMATHLPGLFDRVAGLIIPMLSDKAHAKTQSDNLHTSSEAGRAHGALSGGRSFSLYTAAQLHPRAAFGVGGIGGLVAAAWVSARLSRPRNKLERWVEHLPRSVRRKLIV
jgi:short-subunit dehydrogenase